MNQLEAANEISLENERFEARKARLESIIAALKERMNMMAKNSEMEDSKMEYIVEPVRRLPIIFEDPEVNAETGTARIKRPDIPASRITEAAPKKLPRRNASTIFRNIGEWNYEGYTVSNVHDPDTTKWSGCMFFSPRNEKMYCKMAYITRGTLLSIKNADNSWSGAYIVWGTDLSGNRPLMYLYAHGPYNFVPNRHLPGIFTFRVIETPTSAPFCGYRQEVKLGEVLSKKQADQAKKEQEELASGKIYCKVCRKTRHISYFTNPHAELLNDCYSCTPRSNGLFNLPKEQPPPNKVDMWIVFPPPNPNVLVDEIVVTGEVAQRKVAEQQEETRGSSEATALYNMSMPAGWEHEANKPSGDERHQDANALLKDKLYELIHEVSSSEYTSHNSLNDTFEQKFIEIFHATMMAMGTQYQVIPYPNKPSLLSADIANWTLMKFISHISEVIKVFTSPDHFVNAMQNEVFVEAIESFFNVLKEKSANIVSRKQRYSADRHRWRPNHGKQWNQHHSNNGRQVKRNGNSGGQRFGQKWRNKRD